jgi:hypothetical protein
MMAKINLDVWFEVTDKDQAEEACTTLQLGMSNVMSDFPAGEFVSIDVNRWEEETNPGRFY